MVALGCGVRVGVTTVKQSATDDIHAHLRGRGDGVAYAFYAWSVLFLIVGIILFFV